MDKVLYRGPCVGGPLDGKVRESRFPEGAVLVDRKRNLAWIYRWYGTQFKLFDDSVSLDHDKRWSTANGSRYDIWAVDNDDA